MGQEGEGGGGRVKRQTFSQKFDFPSRLQQRQKKSMTIGDEKSETEKSKYEYE